MNELKIRLNVPTYIADVCCRCVGFEAESDVSERSGVRLSHKEDLLELEIRSGDLPSLRAAMNTYLRWTLMCFNLTNGKISK
ncbi:MAG: hypothetical protein KAU03_06605 [Candidatus Altiarchaeales archaeon]|nr:hypothetical protein [Candidatus Altiarchaeales archaeon]